ncbi:MAG TPA: hypothetical protein VHQ42_08035 [Candidatus Limnocylindria bacterium]|nr:hypothetical protein [Candidatus Limnocylindria bacterium]
MKAPRVHVLPWLRPIGRLFLRDWLAITIGRHILAWRPLTDEELAHELEHVRQWERHGIAFPLAYFADSLRARRAGKRWYVDNRFEADARAAASRSRKR